jgi:hypothetical protein
VDGRLFIHCKKSAMSDHVVHDRRNCKPFHAWLPFIPLLSRMARKLCLSNRCRIKILGWIFDSVYLPRLMTHWPDFSSCIPLRLSFLYDERLNIASVSIPPAVSSQCQVGILLIKSWRNSASDHKHAKSFSLTSGIRCRFLNPISIELSLIVHWCFSLVMPSFRSFDNRQLAIDQNVGCFLDPNSIKSAPILCFFDFC